LTIAKVSSPALATSAVLPAVPTDPDALPLLPRGNTRAKLMDDPCHFMSRNAWILNSGPGAFFREHVTVAHSTGLDLDEHLSRIWLRNLALDDLEICSRLGNLCHGHW
jgi:hypothetical protein